MRLNSPACNCSFAKASEVCDFEKKLEDGRMHTRLQEQSVSKHTACCCYVNRAGVGKGTIDARDARHSRMPFTSRLAIPILSLCIASSQTTFGEEGSTGAQ